MTTIPPIPLKLFDGTTNSTITQTVELPIRFPTGKLQTVTFYITLLDASCSVVLGHNWLTCYNPTIDWVLGSITFKTTEPALPTATPTAMAWSTSLPTSSLPSKPTSKPLKLMAPHISLVNAAAFVRACKLEGSKAYQLTLASMDKLAQGMSTSSPKLMDSFCAYDSMAHGGQQVLDAVYDIQGGRSSRRRHRVLSNLVLPAHLISNLA